MLCGTWDAMEEIDIIYRPQVINNADNSGFRLYRKPTKDVSLRKGCNPMFSQTFLNVVHLCAKRKLVKGTKPK
jgi:hypothetical protein